MKKVYAVKDDSGHWYVIPIELKDLFFAELENGEQDDWEHFEEMFSEFRTGGDLNLVELYAEI
jgi:hypothetical protein